jgi:Fe-S-cluster containining protein
MVKAFECQKCGHCCKSFKDEERGLKGLPLFEWEKEELEKVAKEKGIELNIEVTDIIYDKKSNSYICLNFSLIQEPCPFLKETQCSIYNKRPLICRAFPLVKSPLTMKEGEKFDLSSFIDCPNFDFKSFLMENFSLEEGKPYKISKEKMIREYYYMFGEDMLVSSTIQNILKDFSDSTMKRLFEDKLIKLRKVSRFDYNRVKATPFFEFLKKIGFCDEEGKKELIKQLTDEKETKETIKQFLEKQEKNNL